MQLNLPPPQLFRITFSGKPAITTGVVNLTALFGSTEYILVKVIPPKIKSLDKGEKPDEANDSDTSGESKIKTNVNGTVRLQLCENAGLPLGCFSVVPGESYEVVRQSDLPPREDHEETPCVNQETKKSKRPEAKDDDGEDQTIQEIYSRKGVEEVVNDDEVTQVASPSLSKEKRKKKSVTQTSSRRRKVNQESVDRLSEASREANQNGEEKETQPGQLLHEHSLRQGDAQTPAVNDEPPALTAPNPVEASVSAATHKKSHKSKSREEPKKSADAAEEPVAPRAARAPSRKPKSAAKPPPPPPAPAQRKRRPPVYDSSSGSGSGSRSGSGSPAESAPRRVRRASPAGSDGAPPSPPGPPGASPPVVAPEPPAGLPELRPGLGLGMGEGPGPGLGLGMGEGPGLGLGLGEGPESSAPRSSGRAAFGEDGTHPAMPQDSPALGFTAVNNTLSQEFSLGSSSASSFAEYAY